MPSTFERASQSRGVNSPGLRNERNMQARQTALASRCVAFVLWSAAAAVVSAGGGCGPRQPPVVAQVRPVTSPRSVAPPRPVAPPSPVVPCHRALAACRESGFEQRVEFDRAGSCRALLGFLGCDTRDDPLESQDEWAGYLGVLSNRWEYTSEFQERDRGRARLRPTSAAVMDAIPVTLEETACVERFRAPFVETAAEPIRVTEDDEQFARRVRNAQEGLAVIDRVFSGDATQIEFVEVWNLGTSWSSALRVHPFHFTERYGVYRWTPGEEGCRRAFLRGARIMLERVEEERLAEVRAEERRRAEAAAAAARSARQDVLRRRFAPVQRACASEGTGAATRCAEMDGLTDEEREACRSSCSAAIAAAEEEAAAAARAEAARNEAARAAAAEGDRAAASRAAARADCVASCRRRSDAATCERVCASR